MEKKNFFHAQIRKRHYRTHSDASDHISDWQIEMRTATKMKNTMHDDELDKSRYEWILELFFISTTTTRFPEIVNKFYLHSLCQQNACRHFFPAVGSEKLWPVKMKNKWDINIQIVRLMQQKREKKKWILVIIFILPAFRFQFSCSRLLNACCMIAAIRFTNTIYIFPLHLFGIFIFDNFSTSQVKHFFHFYFESLAGLRSLILSEFHFPVLLHAQIKFSNFSNNGTEK